MRKPEKNTVVFKIFPTDMVFLSKHEKIARKKKCSIFLILTFFPFFFHLFTENFLKPLSRESDTNQKNLLDFSLFWKGPQLGPLGPLRPNPLGGAPGALRFIMQMRQEWYCTRLLLSVSEVFMITCNSTNRLPWVLRIYRCSNKINFWKNFR